VEQRQRAELLDGEDQAAAGADAAELLDGEQDRQHLAAQATVFGRERQSEHVVLREELNDVPWELGTGIDVCRARRDSLVGQLAHAVTQGGLFVGQDGHGPDRSARPEAPVTVLRHGPPAWRRQGERLTQQTEPIRVLIADDHGVVRRGLRSFLELLPDIQVVGEAEDGQQAVAIAQRERPDVVLMDLLMPRVDGLQATAEIKRVQPEVEVVALTSFIEEEKVAGALDAGASGYLLKDATADEVADAIRAAYEGELHLDPAVARLLAQRMRARRAREPVEALTPR
jgi:two-component system, NarL family, response regulator LiaR